MKNLVLFSIILLVISCTQPAPTVDTKAEGEKVMQLSREWSQAAASGDIEKTLSYWADDAVLFSAGEPPLEGKAAIRQMVEASYKMPGFKISWEPQRAEVSSSGDMAYLLENSQITYADSTGQIFTIKNKAVSIWRKQADGAWKNVVDISTPETTPGIN